MEEETLGRGPKGGGKEELGRVSFTKYLESQEDQDMTRLLNFTRTQERRREEIFLYLEMNERVGIYSSSGGNMNGMPFNEG